ncbi:hypothetical protein GCM10007414_38140 [Agarivorans gilvus]|uniref:Transposase IS111A/IS1328/IS1533 N-terminal domain-containing protein n=1 Tax=Agarivorans gilvus TaxID=680279 RepID=A0ABQ1I7C4_9ALTE|nr:hypothetical protein GCM10007414_38140 [Agarivorans gilvus]
MNKHNILFIGLDTRKEFVEVAYIEGQRGAQAVHFGRISSAKTAIVKLAKQLLSKYSQATLHFVYDAGPCGYWIYRLLTSLGHCCYLVAKASGSPRCGTWPREEHNDECFLVCLVKWHIH